MNKFETALLQTLSSIDESLKAIASGKASIAKKAPAPVKAPAKAPKTPAKPAAKPAKAAKPAAKSKDVKPAFN